LGKYELSDVLDAAIYSNKIETNTALPGTVVKYNIEKQTAQVEIAINRIVNGNPSPYPILDDVPVIFSRNKKHGLTFPLESGDGVLLIFNQRNLDTFLAVGKGNVPNDGRMFSINDAVAIPGFFSSLSPMSPTQKRASELRGTKIFVGDPSKTMTPATVAPPIVGTPSGKATTIAPNTSLGLLEIVTALIDLVNGAYYGIAATGGGADIGGGGGIDAATSTALNNLKSDLAKMRL